jgi:hypothetical protein
VIWPFLAGFAGLAVATATATGVAPVAAIATRTLHLLIGGICPPRR